MSEENKNPELIEVPYLGLVNANERSMIMELEELLYLKLGISETGAETYIKFFEPEIIDGELRLPFELKDVQDRQKLSSVPLNTERLKQILPKLDK